MMVQLYIAKRYLFGKKSKNIINLVSGISVAVVAVVTIALFVALSVFNGLNDLVTASFNNIDSDLKIIPKQGKFFSCDTITAYVQSIEGVKAVAEVVEEDVMLRYTDKQFIGVIKGVSDNYNQITKIESGIYDGEYLLQKNDVDYALFGQGLAYSLSIGANFIDPVYIYVPRRNAPIMAAPDQAYRKKFVYASGIYSVNSEVDQRYVFTSIKLARQLLDYKNDANYLEVAVNSENEVEAVQQSLTNALGNTFEVQNRFEQHEFLYKVMLSEKWAIFLIISFILAIASFNVIGSLSMLIIDKKDDIKILQSLGANVKTIKQIFLFEGWMISFLGAIIGLTLGLLICWLQTKFGLLELQGSGSFVVSSYPVKIQISDIFLVLAMVLFIGFWTAYIPVRQIEKKYIL